jgi:hypothetical protein
MFSAVLALAIGTAIPITWGMWWAAMLPTTGPEAVWVLFGSIIFIWLWLAVVIIRISVYLYQLDVEQLDEKQ